MINIPLFITLLTCFALIYLAVGLWASRSVTTLQNYFLANRNLSILQLTFALIASQMGSGMILGTAYRAYHIGTWGILYCIGMSIGFIILGCGLASRMRDLGVATTAEIFETHYRSAKLKLFASTLSVCSLWGILVAQIVASKTLFIGIGINDPYVFIACWLFVICYTMLGGLQAIVMVDIAQVSFIIAVFMATVWHALPLMPKFSTIFALQEASFANHLTLSTLLPALFIPTLFSLIEQDLAQKFFAAKNKATATISAFLAGIFLIIFSSIPLIFGMMAKLSNIEIPNQANPLIVYLGNICPQILFLLVICGIIAAITSTANSLMCAISSNIVQDFSAQLPLQHQKLFITKLISATIGLSALTASYFMAGDIISILEDSYRLSVMCLIVPTLRAYFGKPTNSAPAWAACSIGLVGFIMVKLYPQPGLLGDLYPIAASCIGYWLCNRITHQKNMSSIG